MKKICLVVIMLTAGAINSFAQEFKIITVVESIVPAGMGRSRIIENQGEVDVNAITSEREEGKSNSNDTKRSDLKEAGNNLKETKLLNFYSIAGINFGNIASNDAIIGSKINEMIREGWEVAYITSGVESDAGENDGNGIFITRIYFRRG